MKDFLILLFLIPVFSIAQSDLKTTCDNFNNYFTLNKGKMISENAMLIGGDCKQNMFASAYRIISHESSVSDEILKINMIENYKINSYEEMKVLAKYNYTVMQQWFDKNKKQIFVLIWDVDETGKYVYNEKRSNKFSKQ